MATEPITHLIICRAADADPEGANAQAKVGFTKEPDQDALDGFHDGIMETYTKAFGRPPDRVGVVVLPWVRDLDDDSDRDEDDE